MRSLRSCPAQKPRPAPVNNSAPQVGSASASSSAARSARCISSLKALSRCGRLSVTTRKPSRRSTRMDGWSVMRPSRRERCGVYGGAARAKATLRNATAAPDINASDRPRGSQPMQTKQYQVTHTDAEWRKLLTPEQYDVLRGHGTEAPGSCALNYEKRGGTFSCVGCGQPLFRSRRKFDSGTGWPSFNDPEPDAVETSEDDSYGMHRTEV